jgi:hypothetical protein
MTEIAQRKPLERVVFVAHIAIINYFGLRSRVGCPRRFRVYKSGAAMLNGLRVLLRPSRIASGTLRIAGSMLHLSTSQFHMHLTFWRLLEMICVSTGDPDRNPARRRIPLYRIDIGACQARA